MHLIYTMTFADGSEYVGATSAFANRRQNHMRDLRRARHSRPVQAKFAECGPPTFEAVTCGFSRESLHELEAQVIACRNPPLNVNTTPYPLAPLAPLGKHPKRTRRPVPPPQPYGPYPSKRAAAEALGVNRRDVRAMSYEALLETLAARRAVTERAPKFVGPRLPQGVRLVGGVLDFPANHRKRLNISHHRYKRAQRHGADPLRIGPPVPQVERKVTAAGRTLTLAKWEKETGVRRNTITNRLDHLHWTPEQAVGLEPRQQPRASNITYQDITASLAEHCRRLGLPLHRTYQRFNRGQPLDKVFLAGRPSRRTTPEKPPAPPRKRLQVTFRGHTGPIKEVAAKTGTTYGVLYECLKRGVDPGEYLLKPRGTTYSISDEILTDELRRRLQEIA